MRLEEFMSLISKQSLEREAFLELKNGLPLGVAADGNILLSQRRDRTITTRHTCVVGAGRSEFLQRLLCTLSCLYEKDEASFLILSPYNDYDAFLQLNAMDATVPYILQKAHFNEALKALKDAKEMRERGGAGYPHLFVLLDGVEELQDFNGNGDLEELRAVIDLLAHREDVDVLSGVDLVSSIFKSYPGAFVGIGNALVTAEKDGKAYVTYVEDDASLSLPVTVEYPADTSLTEAITLLNALPKGDKGL